MFARQLGRRIYVEKIFMRPSDISDLRLSIKNTAEDLRFSATGWTGVFKPFETIRMTCTLPLQLVSNFARSRPRSGELEVTVFDYASGIHVDVSSTNVSVFARPIGFIDSVDGDRISGWAWDPGAGGPIGIEISDGKSPQSVLANRYRKDLDDLGIGSGLHGFSCKRPETLGRQLIIVFGGNQIGTWRGA